MRHLGYFLIGVGVQVAVDPFWRAVLVAVVLCAGLSLVVEASKRR